MYTLVMHIAERKSRKLGSLSPEIDGLLADLNGEVIGRNALSNPSAKHPHFKQGRRGVISLVDQKSVAHSISFVIQRQTVSITSRNFAFSLLEGDQESLERQILQGNQVGKGKES